MTNHTVCPGHVLVYDLAKRTLAFASYLKQRQPITTLQIEFFHTHAIQFTRFFAHMIFINLLCQMILLGQSRK